MHIEVRGYLTQLEQDYQGDPLGFLWEFAPVHEWWHTERMQGTQPIGFLTFHHLVIRSLATTFPQGRIPVEPRTLAPYPAVLVVAAQNVSDTESLREFSEDIESWHNGVHTAIGGRFVNPLRNVYLRSFWEFHTFIDQQFEAALGAWGRTFSQYIETVAEGDQASI